jgi:hypothetical protein
MGRHTSTHRKLEAVSRWSSQFDTKGQGQGERRCARIDERVVAARLHIQRRYHGVISIDRGQAIMSFVLSSLWLNAIQHQCSYPSNGRECEQPMMGGGKWQDDGTSSKAKQCDAVT